MRYYGSTLLVVCSALPAQAIDDLHLAAGFRAGVELRGIVGASFVLIHRDKTLVEAYHGFADLQTKRRVDRHTIYHWASLTKSFTGIATMQLAKRGKLKLSDPIVGHVPELKKVHGGEWDVSKVTIRHLLSHSGGFRANTFPFAGREKWQPYEPATWDQLSAMFPYTRLLFAPGTKFSYSNPGIVFVARALEQVTGEDYEVYVDKNVLKPLGMHRSFFDNTPYHLRKYRSNNYSVVDGKPRANGLDLDTGITVSNGGLNAPIPDMLRYLRFLLGVGDAERRAAYDEILLREDLEGMWQPLNKAGRQGKHERSMALTLFVYARDGHRVIGHTGSQKAFQCFFLADPATGVAALAAFNSEALRPVDGQGTRAQMLAWMERMLDQVFVRFRR